MTGFVARETRNAYRFVLRNHMLVHYLEDVNVEWGIILLQEVVCEAIDELHLVQVRLQ
jgi:hypothetical protein